ncbi:MAG: M56 family metallopeptidase [Nakamurella sp.]
MSSLPAPVLATALAVAGVAAAAPGSILLARAGWVSRAPTAALLLWQAVCLCAGLSLTGAALVMATEPLGRQLPAAFAAGARNLLTGNGFRGLDGARIVLFVMAVAFAGHLLVVLFVTIVRAQRRRRHHRAVLDLISGPSHAQDAAVRVLDEQAPLAWTVPGRRSRLVLTAGLMDLLTDRQLLAVLAHERAHLSVRHDLLLVPFQAWATALPVPGMRAARVAVRALVEMQADDLAARTVGPQTVASAIAAVVLADSGDPTKNVQLGDPGSGAAWTAGADSTVAARVRRLQPPRPLPRWGSMLVVLTAILLLAVPTLALFVGWR